MLPTIGRAQRPASDLVGLLLECHERIRSHVALARAAGERDGAAGPEIVDACERVERYFREALPLHVADEDESLVPRLTGRSSDVDAALDEMSAQHVEHRPRLAALFEACASLRAQPVDPERRAALAELARDLEEAFETHLQIEETLVFPAVQRLNPSLQDEILREVRARRAPKA